MKRREKYLSFGLGMVFAAFGQITMASAAGIPAAATTAVTRSETPPPPPLEESVRTVTPATTAVVATAAQAAERKEREEKIAAASAADSLECSICRSSLGRNNVQALACAHTFHHACIRPWLNDHNTCPICRRVVSEQRRNTILGRSAAVPASAGSASAANMMRAERSAAREESRMFNAGLERESARAQERARLEASIAALQAQITAQANTHTTLTSQLTASQTSESAATRQAAEAKKRLDDLNKELTALQAKASIFSGWLQVPKWLTIYALNHWGHKDKRASDAAFIVQVLDVLKTLYYKDSTSIPEGAITYGKHAVIAALCNYIEGKPLGSSYHVSLRSFVGLLALETGYKFYSLTREEKKKLFIKTVATGLGVGGLAYVVQKYGAAKVASKLQEVATYVASSVVSTAVELF